MTDKHDYTASVRAKGLDNTGVTKDLAREMYNTLGRSTLAIVELRHERQINDNKTGRKVELVIDMLEPSTDENLDEHLRNLTNTLYQNRALKSEEQQLTIDTADDITPKVADVIAAGRDLEPHTYTGVGDDVDQCEVCGDPADTPVHADLDDDWDGDPDDTGENDEDEEEEDAAAEVQPDHDDQDNVQTLRDPANPFAPAGT